MNIDTSSDVNHLLMKADSQFFYENDECEHGNDIEKQTTSEHKAEDLDIVEKFLFFLGCKYVLCEKNLFLSKIVKLPENIDEVESQIIKELKFDDLINVWLKVIHYKEGDNKTAILQKYILPVISMKCIETTEVKSSFNKFKEIFIKYIYNTTKSECSDMASIFDRRLLMHDDKVANLGFDTKFSLVTETPIISTSRNVITKKIDKKFIDPRFTSRKHRHLPSLCQNYDQIPVPEYCNTHHFNPGEADYQRDTNCVIETTKHKQLYTLIIPRRKTIPDYCNIEVPDDVYCYKPNKYDIWFGSDGSSYSETKNDYMAEKNCWDDWLKKNETRKFTTEKPTTSEHSDFSTENIEEISNSEILITAAGIVFNILSSIPTVIFEVKKLKSEKLTSVEVLRSIFIIGASVALSSAPCLLLSGYFKLSSIFSTLGHLGKALSAEANLKHQLDSLLIRQKKFGKGDVSQFVLKNAQADAKARLVSDSITGFFSQCVYIAVGICDVLIPLSQKARLCTMLPLFIINSCGSLFKFNNAYDNETYDSRLLKKSLSTNIGLAFLFQKLAMNIPLALANDLLRILDGEIRGWNHIGISKLTDHQEKLFLKKVFEIAEKNDGEKIFSVLEKEQAYMVIDNIYNFNCHEINIEDEDGEHYIENIELRCILLHIKKHRKLDKAFFLKKKGILNANNVYNNIISIVIKSLAFKEGVASGLIEREYSIPVTIDVETNIELVSKHCPLALNLRNLEII